MNLLYHITDFDNLESILNNGLNGNPVVYLAENQKTCRAIRSIQKEYYEKYHEGSIILSVDVEGYDLFDDPDTDTGAWMIYADIPKERIIAVSSD